MQYLKLIKSKTLRNFQMAFVLVSMYDNLIDMLDKNGDPRVQDYYLMRGPLPTMMICLTYVFIVKYLGPKLMENRKPFHLKNTLIVYNVFQVILSSYLFYEVRNFEIISKLLDKLTLRKDRKMPFDPTQIK